MFFKEEVQKVAYGMYLDSICVSDIAFHIGITPKDVNKIIDYLNETYL